MNAVMHSSTLPDFRARAAASVLAHAETTERIVLVERTMSRLARGSRVDRAGSMALEQIATGGKRLRARLALSACRALGVPDSSAVAWAAAVETLHNATLVHDDIQDGDTTRRGAPTLWVNHGIAQAINAGDLLLMLPFLALAELPAEDVGRLALLLSEHATRIVRGQVEELGLLASGRLDLASYVHAAAGKTGGLIALPVVGAAALAGRGDHELEELDRVFTDLGVLFQLQDDVVDLFGDKGRGEVGCDVYEGKVSALVVAQIERRPETTEFLLEILARPRSVTTSADVEAVRALFVESGALEGVLDHVDELGRSILGTRILSEEPALLEVAAELVALSLRPIEPLFAARSGGTK